MRWSAPTRLAIAELSASAPMRTATSSPSSTRSTGRSMSDSATDTSGKRSRNSIMIGDMQPPEQDRRSDAQLAARRGALPDGGPFDLVEIGEHAPRARQEPLAGLGDADRTGGAVEQPYPEPRFELADRARDRGRRAAEPPRRLGKTSPLGDLDEHRNVADPIHIVSIIAIMSCKEQALSSLVKLPF